MNWKLKTPWKVWVLLVLQVSAFLPETIYGYTIEEGKLQEPYYEAALDDFPMNANPRGEDGGMGLDYSPSDEEHQYDDYFLPEDSYLEPMGSSSEALEGPEETPRDGEALKPMSKRSIFSSWFPPKYLPSREKFRRSGRGWFFNLGGSRNHDGRHSFLRRHQPFCFPHGMSCTMAPNSCCNDSVCRCNIFGSNCKCDRPGLLFGK